MDIDAIKDSLRPDMEVIKTIDAYIKEINTRLKGKKLKAVCVAGGSVAKGTFLKEDFDADLFVRFDKSYEDKALSDLLESALSGINYERVHGSRDYFQIKGRINYEIVPVLEVNDPKESVNVTDMSPLHVEWVKSHLKVGMEDEIRLAKKFCKAAKVYGAESYIKGFSGHVIDILIVNYGSFDRLVDAASKWKAPVYVDPESHYKNVRDAMFMMNKSKVQGPIVVVDPLLPSRNAACAVSDEQLQAFRKACLRYQKCPGEDFFIEKRFDRAKAKKGTFIISAEAEPGKRDVVGGKLMKAYEYLCACLEERGFEFKSSWEFDKKQSAVYCFECKEESLPETKIVAGPPATMEEHVRAFRSKYSNTYSEGGRLFAKEQVGMRSFMENAKEVLSRAYFKERLKRWDIEQKG